MLILAIGVLGLAVLAGGWLGAQVLMLDEPMRLGVHWKGLAHGALGLAGLAVLAVALRGPPDAHARRLGAGNFGLFAGALIAGAALAGLTMLLLQLRRRAVPPGVVAAHGLLAISGYTLVVTYLTMLH